MAAPTVCPSSSQLQRLLVEAPTTAKQAELVDHLDHCHACQRALEKLAGASPDILDAASAFQSHVFATESLLKEVLDSIEKNDTLSTLYRPSDRIAWGRSLLQPQASLESLGPLADYEVKDVRGQGGMGLVFKAFEPALQRWVAIKVLAPNLANDQVARIRFAREA